MAGLGAARYGGARLGRAWHGVVWHGVVYEFKRGNTMQHVAFRITGKSPLLLNRFHEDAQQEATRGIHERHADWPDSQVDAASRLYLLDGDINRCYFPAENLRQSIIAAAARHKIGRRSATSDIAAAVYVLPDALTLAGDWIVDSRPVVIPATRGRVLRHRPRFDEWSIAGRLSYDDGLVDAQLVRQIVNDAGDYVGIGDFRPAHRGPYGRFDVSLWTPQ